MIADCHIHVGPSEKCSWSVDARDLKHATEFLIMPNPSIIGAWAVNQRFIETQMLPYDRCRKLLLIDPREGKNWGLVKGAMDRPHVVGLKFHPSVCQVTASSPSLNSYLELLPGKVLMIHCGRDPKSDYAYAHELALMHPEINIIAAHLGGLVTDKVEMTIRFLSKAGVPDNMYFDTSGVFCTWLVKKFIDTVGVGKVLFGSDIPYNDFTISRFMIDQLGLTYEEKDRINFWNLAQVIHGKDECAGDERRDSVGH
jgi:predicted TIM-barrel fold metal-dependent hydrolase